MGVASLRGAALRMVLSELRRGVNVRSQLSLYEALEEAHLMGVDSHTEQARKGGRAKKTDALSQLIQSIVERNPRITVAQLAEQLKAQQGLGIIADIDGTTITFDRANGSLKEASVSGLKDRLSRAKKARSR